MLTKIDVPFRDVIRSLGIFKQSVPKAIAINGTPICMEQSVSVLMVYIINERMIAEYKYFALFVRYCAT